MTFVKRSSPARAMASARSRCSWASSSCPLIQHSRPSTTSVLASPQVLPRSCRVAAAVRSSSAAASASSSGNCMRAVALAVVAIAAASSSPLSRNRRTQSSRPGDHLVGGVLPHLAPAHEEGGDALRARAERVLLAEQLLHPAAHLGERPGDPPVDEQAPGELRRLVEPVGPDQVAHRRAEVRQLELELDDGIRLPAAAQPGAEATDEVRVVVGVQRPHPVRIAAGAQAPQCVLPHDREHREHDAAVHVGLLDERPVHERGEGVDDLSVPRAPCADRLDGVEGEPRREHAEVLEQIAFGIREQAHAPLDRRAHRAVPLRQVA